MSTRFAVAAFLSVVAIAGCAAPPPPPPEVDVAAEAQTIRDLSALWLEAAKVRDGATIDGMFAADATTIYDGEVHEGLAAIRAARDEEWAEEEQGDLDWTTSSVLVAASGDLAVERGSWTEQGVDDDEIEVGEYVTVWTKIDGQWKVLIDAGTEIEDVDDVVEGEDD
jgi:ketosteroid isomerase-like protein